MPYLPIAFFMMVTGIIVVRRRLLLLTGLLAAATLQSTYGGFDRTPTQLDGPGAATHVLKKDVCDAQRVASFELFPIS
jgi:hypothetical protein